MLPVSFYISALDHAENVDIRDVDIRDVDKLTWIYENLLGLMLGVAKKYVRQYQTEEDVVHDAILKIIDNLDHIQLDDVPRTRSYVCLIVKCCAIDWLRKREPYRETELETVADMLEDAEPLPLDYVVSEDGYARLLQCIRALPDTYRMVCEFKFVHGLKEREIADLMQITEKNVSVRVSRGRQKLMQMLQEERS